LGGRRKRWAAGDVWLASLLFAFLPRNAVTGKKNKCNMNFRRFFFFKRILSLLISVNPCDSDWRASLVAHPAEDC
jgi:hypothetical protein